MCSFDGCNKPKHSRGLCSGHYMQDYMGKPLTALVYRRRGPCLFDGCDDYAKNHGLCTDHYEYAILNPFDPRIHTYPGKSSDGEGYVRIRAGWHPNARLNDGRVSEHIFVMSRMLGRALLPGENVHHKNGIRSDNRPENLELWVSSQPAGQRPEDKVAHAVEMLRRYAPELLADGGQ